MNCQRWDGYDRGRGGSFLYLVLLQAGAGWAWTVKVVGIADGDMITVVRDGREQVKMRLYGIDAPESGQSFGKASKRNLSSMVHGRSVQVEVMDTDRYGRTVALIFMDGEDVNAAQLRSGHAWLYRQYCKIWVYGQWAGLETEARSKGAGLWADKKPTPPWQWRRHEKGASDVVGREISPQSCSAAVLKAIMPGNAIGDCHCVNQPGMFAWRSNYRKHSKNPIFQ